MIIKVSMKKELSKIEQEPIQVFLGGYQRITSFSEFERHFGNIKGDVQLKLHQKTIVVDQFNISEILVFRPLSIDQLDQSSNSANIFKKVQKFYHVAVFDQIYVRNIYIQTVNDEQISEMINNSTGIQNITWSVKVQIKSMQDNQIVLLQLSYDIDQGGSSEQHNLKEKIREITAKIQVLYKKGDWLELYNLASHADFRVFLGGSFIQNYMQKVAFSEQMICELISLVTGKTQQQIEFMFFLYNQVYNQEVIYSNIQGIFKNSITLTKKHLERYKKWVDFILQPKFDGVVALLICRRGIVAIMFLQEFEVIGQGLGIDDFVLEVEIYENQIIAYDMHYNKHSIVQLPMLQRLYMIPLILTALRQGLASQQYVFTSKPFVLITKEIAASPAKLAEAFENTFKQDLQAHGIILNTNQAYNVQKKLKWIQVEKTAIDFFCQLIDPLLINQQQDPEFVYLGLFCQITSKDLAQSDVRRIIRADFARNSNLVIFQSSQLKELAFIKRSAKEEQDNPLNNKVAECMYDPTTSTWKLYRIRHDKLPSQKNFGNYFLTAQNILNFIIEPFGIQSLYKLEARVFQQKHSILYSNMYHFFNIIKEITINTICKQHRIESVLDLGIGNGNDIPLYVEAGVQKLIGVDVNNNHLQIAKQRFQQAVDDVNSTMEFIVNQIDLNNKQSFEILQTLIQENNVQFVNLNFSVDFFIKNLDLFDRTFKNIQTPTHAKSKHNIFISFLFLNGRKLFDLLQKQEDIQIFEHQTLKYQYQRAYETNTMQDLGLTVLLKPYNRETLIERHIFNPDFLVQLMTRNGFKILQKQSISGVVEEGHLFSQDQIKLIQLQFKALNQQDQFHISLFDLFIFEKQK